VAAIKGKASSGHGNDLDNDDKECCRRWQSGAAVGNQGPPSITLTAPTVHGGSDQAFNLTVAPTNENELQAAKNQIFNEVCRQMLLL
jgi:hypothetical protein